MIRIGIFGTDNSHSIQYSKWFNIKGEKGYIPGFKVVALYGLEQKRNEEVAEKGHVDLIVKRPKDMLPLIDAAIVDFRHGSRHWKYAKMCIEAGIPTFIDKPLAASVADAEKIVKLAQRKRVPICSFSSLRFGTGMDEFKKAVAKIGKPRSFISWGPGNAREQYDGIFFYAVHQVEMALELFGNDVISARGQEHDGVLAGEFLFKNGTVATIHQVNTANYWAKFEAVAFGDDGKAEYDGAKAEDGFGASTRLFSKMFKTGKMPYSYKEMTVSTRVLAAMEKSMRNGGVAVRVR
jgi:predicted dehydrogenase